jgi:lipoprotein-anchoring transpeptidase ErfK/SrfK
VKRAVIPVLAALVALLGAGCGSSDTTASSTPTAAAVSQPPAKPPAAKPRLKIYDRGQPVIWLRPHARVKIRSAPGAKVIKTLGSKTEFGSPTVLSVFRHTRHWAGVPTPLLPNGTLGWVKLNSSKLRSGWTSYEIDVDLSQRTAQLRRGAHVLRSFAVTIGAPGIDTPTGRFAVTDTFRGNLDPAYGCCAVATTARQPHLPSGWLGGNRIAFHGTTGSLGLALSHGCIRASNEDVNLLVNRVPLGTPVVIQG